jgi:hypothetical protein
MIALLADAWSQVATIVIPPIGRFCVSSTSQKLLPYARPCSSLCVPYLLLVLPTAVTGKRGTGNLILAMLVEVVILGLVFALRIWS